MGEIAEILNLNKRVSQGPPYGKSDSVETMDGIEIQGERNRASLFVVIR